MQVIWDVEGGRWQSHVSGERKAEQTLGARRSPSLAGWVGCRNWGPQQA